MKSFDFKKYIKQVPDFPVEGILFEDWTPILSYPEAYKALIDAFVEKAKKYKPDAIISAESRGFWIGCPLAIALNIPLIPARKSHKLPRKTICATFNLEYGSDTLCIHEGDLKPNSRVLIIDDIIATGGTVDSMLKLIKKEKSEAVAACFIMEIPGLKGIKLLEESKVPVEIIIKK